MGFNNVMAIRYGNSIANAEIMIRDKSFKRKSRMLFFPTVNKSAF